MVCSCIAHCSNDLLDLHRKRSALDLDHVIGIAIACVRGVEEAIEEVALDCSAHDDQTHISPLLDVADEGAKDIGLERALVCFVNDQHAVSA